MKVFFYKLKEIRIKIESIETSCNLEHDTKNMVGDFKIDNLCHQLIVDSSSSIEDIWVQARALGQYCINLIPRPISPLSSPMLTHAWAYILTQQLSECEFS